MKKHSWLGWVILGAAVVGGIVAVKWAIGKYQDSQGPKFGAPTKAKSTEGP